MTAQQPGFATTAYLIADPTRAAMFTALLDGRARSAGDIAAAAGVTAPTASWHLQKLLASGLFIVSQKGRHRYYSLAGSHVASALEQLSSICPPQSGGSAVTATLETRRLRYARCCYDHLAGRVSIAVTKCLEERSFLVAEAQEDYKLTKAGLKWFGSMGVELAGIPYDELGSARRCLDWTERDYHLAGPLGARLMETMVTSGWVRRCKSSRAIEVTPLGVGGLRKHLDLDVVAMIAQ